MNKGWKIALILVAVVCFAVALSYPIRYSLEKKDTDEDMARLAAIREAGRQRGAVATSTPDAMDDVPEETVGATAGVPEDMADATTCAPEKTVSATAFVPEVTVGAATNAPETTSGATAFVPEITSGATVFVPEATVAATVSEAEEKVDAAAYVPEVTAGATEYAPKATAEATTHAPKVTIEMTTSTPEETLNASTYLPEATDPMPEVTAESTPAPTPAPTPSPTPTVVPTPTPNRRLRTSKAQPYPEKEKVVFEEADILPEFQELYEINHDLVGWITIPDTVIDYPVVQSADSEFYLKHDFYGEENSNGQIILDAKCDPYTPSYNLVVSGHNMKSGRMFGELVNYMYESYWKKRKTLAFDVLTEHREYVIFAAFFSADYDVDEEGFRYNVDIQYRLDMETWLEEIRANQLYDTGIDVEFGDEFLTLTTCNRWRRQDGRFVLVCRRIREGEEIE